MYTAQTHDRIDDLETVFRVFPFAALFLAYTIGACSTFNATTSHESLFARWGYRFSILYCIRSYCYAKGESPLVDVKHGIPMKLYKIYRMSSIRHNQNLEKCDWFDDVNRNCEFDELGISVTRRRWRASTLIKYISINKWSVSKRNYWLPVSHRRMNPVNIEHFIFDSIRFVLIPATRTRNARKKASTQNMRIVCGWLGSGLGLLHSHFTLMLRVSFVSDDFP